MNSKKPYKTKIERDIRFSKDIKVSGIQGGKVIGNNLALFSFIMGIPLLLIGLFGLFNMALGLGFQVNNATIILVLVVELGHFMVVIIIFLMVIIGLVLGFL